MVAGRMVERVVERCSRRGWFKGVAGEGGLKMWPGREVRRVVRRVVCWCSRGELVAGVAGSIGCRCSRGGISCRCSKGGWSGVWFVGVAGECGLQL